MKLFLLTQRSVTGWDTYDSAVVAADCEETAKTIHPSGCGRITTRNRFNNTWPNNPDVINAKYIGETNVYSDSCVVLSSFNAG